ncbi:MAG: universal stress protein [Pseudomonadota bacterium]
MAYKSIFTALTGFDEASPALALATSVSRQQDAHLSALCVGHDPLQGGFYEIGANAMIVQAAIEEATARSEEVSIKTSSYLQRAAVIHDVATAVSTAAGVGRTVASHARFADLAVLDMPFRKISTAADNLVLEGILFEARCPTLIAPNQANLFENATAVIGWNESAQALSAVKAALPVLKVAAAVHIAVIDPPSIGPERSDPGGALAIFLSRHGIRCDIQVLSREGLRVSDRLQQHVQEQDAELLVMGAYGHSRFREAVLGGATQEILETAKTAVFLAH